MDISNYNIDYLTSDIFKKQFCDTLINFITYDYFDVGMFVEFIMICSMSQLKLLVNKNINDKKYNLIYNMHIVLHIEDNRQLNHSKYLISVGLIVYDKRQCIMFL